jgi:hypothetical protein
MKEPFNNLILGVIYAYISVLLYLLFKDFEFATLYKSLFFFIICVFTPFLAIGKAIYTVPAVLFGLITCYFIFTRLKGKQQSIAFAAFLVGWEIYGMRSLVLMSGGA